MVHSPVVKPLDDLGRPNQRQVDCNEFPLLCVDNPDPAGLPYDPNAAQSFLGNGTTTASNPLAIIDGIDESLDNHRTFGNVYADISLMKDLTFRSMVGIDLDNFQGSFFRGNSLLYRNATTGDPYAQSNAATRTNWVWENTLNYKKALRDVHNFTALLGYTAQKDVSESNTVIANQFPDDQVQTLTGGVISDGTSIKEEWSLVSLLARVNYNYNYKYLLTATIRSDRSSRFGPGNETGIFPSFSVAWRMMEEDFMRDQFGFLSELKLRASYGETGNFLIPNYGAIGLLGQGLYIDDDQPSVGVC